MADDFDDDFDDDDELDDDFDDDEDFDDDDEIDDDSLIEDEEDEEDGEEDEEEQTSEEDEDVLDLEEELHPDDVEAPLDALLAERITAGSLDDDEDELSGEPGSTKVVPRRATEFHCSSCFLVLPNHMLADKKKMLCKDCA